MVMVHGCMIKYTETKKTPPPLPEGTLEIKPGNFVKPGLFKDAITE